MVYEVAYNDCYGGFRLSVKAHALGKKLSGDDEWGGFLGHCTDIPRHDPLLIQVIKTLGTERASHPHGVSKIKIEKISQPVYRIEENDGHETVITPDYEHKWIVIG